MIKFLGGGQADVLIARHHDRLTRNPDDFARLMGILWRQLAPKLRVRLQYL
jgi:hypothetical protein